MKRSILLPVYLLLVLIILAEKSYSKETVKIGSYFIPDLVVDDKNGIFVQIYLEIKKTLKFIYRVSHTAH